MINHSDHQAHSLVDSPVFIDNNPVAFTDWEGLRAALPPDPDHFPDRLMCVCEDQNIWPVSNEVMPDIQDRQMQIKDFEADAEQNAVATATRNSQASALMSAWSIASLMVFCIVSAIIVLFALQSKLAQDIINDVSPGAAVFFMLGLPLFGRKRKNGSENAPMEDESAPLEGDLVNSVGNPVQSKRWRRRHFKDWEVLRVFDEVAGYAWNATLPLSVLIEHLPLNCRYSQELSYARYLAMGFFGGMVFLIGWLMALAAGWHLLWATVVPFLASSTGVLFGYLKGYGLFMIPPVWIVRRLYVRVPVEGRRDEYAIDYEALPLVVPEVHTKLTGVPMEIAVSDRRASAESTLRTMQQNARNGRGGATTATVDTQNLAVGYMPRVWRAGMMYEVLKGRAVQKKMQAKFNKGDKLQKYSMAGMALGSVGLLIVAVIMMGG